eukprot:s4134_g8.t2
MKSDHGCVHALLRILPDRKTIVATAKERRAAAEMAGIYSVSRLQARLLLHREHYPGIALITVVKQRDGAAAKEMGATYPDGHETRERDDPERLLNSFGGRVTNKDSADYTVPLISRDPEAAQKYDIWISTWVIDLQVLITAVKQRDGAAAKEMGATYPDGHETRERDLITYKIFGGLVLSDVLEGHNDLERLLNSFGGLVTNKDIADHIVPLISRDPEAAQFLRKYDIWISTWVIDLQALITAVKQRDGAAAKDLERLLNSFGGLVTNKVWWFLLWLRKSSRLPGAAEWCMQQVIGLKVCWLEI